MSEKRAITFRTLKKVCDDVGEICKVYGHWWENVTENTAYCTYPLIYSPQRRKCRLCGKIEEKTQPTWEEQTK